MTFERPFATRVADLQPFRTLALLSQAQARIKAGRDVIRLDVGEPDFGTPEPVLAAARQALDAGVGRYTEAIGRPALREAIAASYQQRYGVTIAPSRILVTTGSSAGLMLLVSALLNAGDTILSAAPGYPSHPVFASVANGNVTALKSAEPGRLWPTAAEYDAAWTEHTRALLIASPSNPTGSVIDWEDAKALMDLAKSKNAAYISEELYHGLSFDSPDRSALEHSDDVFVINGFSKYFGMTGWRLGWLIVPEAYVDVITMLAQHLYLSPPDISQAAALACFTDETIAICEARRQTFASRRDLLLPRLEDAGFKIPYPAQGGLFIFADASRFTRQSYVFAQALLEQADVSIAPGIDFGDFDAFMRFSLCTRAERLEEAMDRIVGFLAKRGGV